MSYPEYRSKKMSKVRVGLSRKQVEVAMSGNVTMLIWLGKQWLDQKDRQEIDQTNHNYEVKFVEEK